MASVSHTLSPSSFGFLWEECPRCYWLQTVLDFRRPSMPFPSIFTQIDLRMKDWFSATEWHSFAPGQPRFKIEYEERMIRSAPISLSGHEATITLRGKFDSIILFEDGTRAVCDFKTSSVKPEYIEKYWRQLHAYAYALENPAIGSLSPGRVDRIGLAVFDPDRFAINPSSRAVLGGRMEWIEMKRDDQRFMAFLDEVLALLEEPDAPQASPKCQFCKYRKAA